jgi:hypothetical protein
MAMRYARGDGCYGNRLGRRDSRLRLQRQVRDVRQSEQLVHTHVRLLRRGP